MIQTIESYLENRPTITNNVKNAGAVKKVSPEGSPIENRSLQQPNVNKPSQQPNINRSAKKNVTCYNCFEEGHISINCPKPQRRIRCSECLRSGHLKENCTESGQGKDILRINCRETNSELTKEIKVNNVKLAAFIDPGSQQSLIGESAANEVGLLTHIQPRTLKGFGGGEFTTSRKLDVNIEMDKVLSKAELLVVDDDLIPKAILLGSDYICKSNERLIIQSGQCRWEEINVENAKIGTVTDEEKRRLFNALNEYSGCFGETLRSVGKFRISEMKIELNSNKPIVRKPFRIPFAKRAEVDKITSELLELDIIRQSSSSFSSPVVLVRKSNGEDTLCRL